MIKEAPEKVKKLITDYTRLKFYETEVITPYYRNVKRVRAELRSLAGKGSPEEIGEETIIYAKLRGVDLSTLSSSQIREFMQSQGIGIDCSGFVSHLLNEWSKAIGKGRLDSHIRFPKASIYRRLIRRVRFIENLSADVLSSQENSVEIGVKAILPGDMIRLKGLQHGDHIAIITRVEYDSDGMPIQFEYSHSSEQYGENNGVKKGRVRIKDLNSGLKDQEWLETDENGKCWTYEQLMKDYQDNGLRRPKFLV